MRIADLIRGLLYMVAACLVAHACFADVQLTEKVFPGIGYMDGNWAALYAASDGKVYVGLAYHGGDGHMACYDSKTDQMTDIGNLTELCGEQNLHRGPQSKIHAKFGEGKDGKIYFGTHGGWWFNYARFATKEGYPGAHWMDYDPHAGRVTDLGLATPYQGINTGAYDPQFNRIYGLTHPRGEFVYYDVASKKTVNKGRVNNWDSICRTLAIDDEGKVYGSFGAGHVFRYDPKTDALTELSVQLPVRQKGISLGRDYTKAETGFRTMIWDSVTSRFYGVDESETRLFSFSPHDGNDGRIEALGSLAIPALAHERNVPFATLTLTLGHDRKLYYAAAGLEFDYSASAGAVASHLMTYDLSTGKTVDHGQMILPDGRRVLGANSASTGPDGTIYFVGAVEAPAGAKSEEIGGKIGSTAYRLALLLFKP